MYDGKLYTYFSRDTRSDDVREWFANGRFSLAKSPKGAERIIVAGGDGTLLEAISKYGKLGIPFFGINRGTVGFLLNPVSSIEQFETLLENDAFTVVVLHLLKATFIDDKGRVKEFHAFNDVYINAAHGTQVKGTIEGSGHFPKKEIFGDGIIIATAQGSTSYNRNAGGARLKLHSPDFAIRTICQSASIPSIRDTIDPQRVTIEIVKGKAVGIADTAKNKVIGVRKVVIERSDYTVKLEFNPEFDFEKFRYL